MRDAGSWDPADFSAIFLTGATGLVGRLLLRRLAAEWPNRPVFALVRDHEAISGRSGLELIPGDITEPELGMPEDTYKRMCGSVGVVVHCAASTHLARPLHESRRVNVEGTENVLAFARRARNLKLFLHISSTYVAGRRPGELHEAPLREPAGWFSPYEQSKFEAEQLIFEKANDLPWTIVRLSTLVGNSRTGHISQFNYFHQLIRLVPRNPFPVIPGTPCAPVDVVPDDWVTEALLRMVQKAPAPASVLHLCAGPSQGSVANFRGRQNW